MNNSPAFPCPSGHATIKEWHPGHGDVERTVAICSTGVSMLDYFAAKAIGPLMASDGFEQKILSGGFPLEHLPRFAAEIAYEIAEAMMVEREKRISGRKAETKSDSST